MIILNARGKFCQRKKTQEALESSKAARPTRNIMTQRRLAARLQELVEEQMPEELDFFIDWLYGEVTPSQLWERYVHATVETTPAQKAAQLRERFRSVLARLQTLADDDTAVQLLLGSMEGYTRTVNSKPVEDEERRS